MRAFDRLEWDDSIGYETYCCAPGCHLRADQELIDSVDEAGNLIVEIVCRKHYIEGLYS